MFHSVWGISSIAGEQCVGHLLYIAGEQYGERVGPAAGRRDGDEVGQLRIGVDCV